MTNKDITKIYFQGNEIVALYQGSTLIFKKKPTGVYIIKGSVIPDSTAQNIQFTVNGVREQFDVNNDKTFEHTFVNVPVTNMDDFALPITGSLKTIDLSSLNTSQVTSMIRAFYGCSDLMSIDLTNVDTSNVTKMIQMFDQCNNLTSLDVSNFNTSNVTNMSSMFSNCQKLSSLDVSNFNTSKVTNMHFMFSNCKGLTSLDVSNFDTSKVKIMIGMFKGCSNLTSLDLSSFDTSNVMNMSSMFMDCSGLTSLDLSSFDTSNVMNMQYMFGWCDTLVNLYINFDTSNVTDYDYLNDIFISDKKLENVVGKFEGAKVNLDLQYCPLTAQSAMVFINGLATVTTTRRLSLSATTYDSLTTEQIAIATAKGWTVTRS